MTKREFTRNAVDSVCDYCTEQHPCLTVETDKTICWKCYFERQSMDNQLKGSPEYMVGPMPSKAHAALALISILSTPGGEESYSSTKELSDHEIGAKNAALEMLGTWFKKGTL
jgi:hypothetical protein